MTARVDLPPKPTSLKISVEDGRLVGTDESGNEWTIRWCGNGQYSHWVLTLRAADNIAGDLNMSQRGWYVFRYPESSEKRIKEQISAAEAEHRIYL